MEVSDAAANCDWLAAGGSGGGGGGGGGACKDDRVALGDGPALACSASPAPMADANANGWGPMLTA